VDHLETRAKRRESKAGPLGTRDTVILLAATAGTVVVNWLANLLRFGGETTGSVSSAHSTLVTPAGYAFSIWSLIYVGLFAFAAQALRDPGLDQLQRRRIFWSYLGSSVLNATWIVVWHLGLVTLSAGVIAALLASVLVIYKALDRHRAVASLRQRATILVPISLYAAWLSVATVINITIAVRANGLTGMILPSETWATLLLVMVAGLTLVVALPRRDVAWLGVATWALAAVGVARLGEPSGSLTIVAFSFAGLLGLVGATMVVARRRPANTTTPA